MHSLERGCYAHISNPGWREGACSSQPRTDEALASYLAVPGEYQDGGRGKPFRRFLEMNFLEASFLCKNPVISFDCSELIS